MCIRDRLFMVCCWPQSQKGETPFVQVSTTLALTCPETVHQRPCMTREMETWLSDSRVGNSSVVEHRSRRPVLSPLHNCVNRCHVWSISTKKLYRWHRSTTTDSSNTTESEPTGSPSFLPWPVLKKTFGHRWHMFLWARCLFCKKVSLFVKYKKLKITISCKFQGLSL